MGGKGSGRYMWSRRWTVEDSLVLGISDLRDTGFVPPSREWTAELAWRDTRTGDIDSSILCSLLWFEGSRDWGIKLRYAFLKRDGRRQPVECVLRLTTTKPHYGGIRHWLVCPLCGRKVTKVYLPPAVAVFGCRRCHSLAYQCQRESPALRASRKERKIRWLLKQRAESRGELYGKPKYMHQRTYKRLVLRSRIWEAIMLDRLLRMLN